MTTDLLTLYSQLLKPVRIRIIINSPKINNYSNSNLLYNFKAVNSNKRLAIDKVRYIVYSICYLSLKGERRLLFERIT